MFDDWDETPINDLHSTQSKSNDLKSQLSDLQKQLNLGDIKPVRPARNEDLKIVLPPIVSNTHNSGLSNKVDNSVDFLGDLSDNLLMKSRKLNYENQKLLKEISDLKNSNDLINKQVSNLTILNKRLSDNEEEQNSNIWKLESELQETQSKLENSQSEVSKLISIKENADLQIKNLQITVDQLESEKKITTETNKSVIDKLTSKLNEAKESNDSLSNENDLLAKTIDDLKSQIDNLISENHTLSTKAPAQSNDESFSEFDDSILIDPTPLNQDVSNLDDATLKKNLELAYRKLHKLLSQNSKLKIELNKAKHISSPAKKNILDPIFNENKENVNDRSWGAFNDDSFTKSSTKNVTEPDTILNSDDDGLDFSEIEGFEGSSPVTSRRQSFNTTVSNKPAYMMILPKTTLELDHKTDLLRFDFSKFQTIPVPNTLVGTLIEKSEKGNSGTDFMSNMDLVSKDVIENLNNEVSKMNDILDHPTIDYLKEKAEENDFVLTEKISFNELSQKSLILEENEKELKSITAQFNDLKLKYDNLDVEYAISKLINHKVIPLVEYNEIQTKVKDLESQVIERNTLVEKMENDTVEKDTEISSLKKTNEELSSQLSEVSDSLQLMKNELESLKNSYENPDLDYIKAKAVDHVVLHKDNHNNLLQQIETLESDLNNKIESIEKLQQLQASPSFEYLTEKALSSNHKLVALPEYEQLHEKITQLEEEVNSPSVEYIKAKAQSLGYVAVEASELEKLQNTVNNPPLEFIKSNVEKKGEAMIPLTELDELKSIKESFESPSLEYLHSKCMSQNHIVIPSNEHDSLLEKLESLRSELDTPTFDYIKSKANTLNHVVVPEKEYEDLVTNSENLSKKCSETEYELAEKNQLLAETEARLNKSELVNRDALLSINGLQEKISLSSTHLADLADKVESLRDQNKLLHKQLETPSLEYLNEKSTMLNHTLVPESEHFDLKSKVTVLSAQISDKDEQITSITESKNDIELKHDELKSKLTILESESNELQTKLQKLQSHHDSPKLDYLKSKAADLQAKVILLEEYDQLMERNSANEVKIDELNQRLSNNEKKIAELENDISEKENKLKLLESDIEQLQANNADLVNKLDSPDLQYITSKASVHKLAAIPMSEHESMKEELKQKGSEIQKYKQIQSELDSKHVEIEQLVDAKNELVSQIESQQKLIKDMENEKKSLQELIDSPSAEFIRDKSKAHALVVVPIDEHKSLKEQLSKTSMELSSMERDLESLQRIKKDLELQGMNSVSIELHDSIQKELHDTKSELDTYKEQISEKDVELKQSIEKIEELKSVEEKLALKEKEFADLVTKSEELIAKSAKLDVSFELKSKHAELDKMLVSNSEMQKQIELLSLKEKELEETLSNMNTIKNELSEVKNMYEKPGLKYIEQKSKDLGYVPITMKERTESESNVHLIEELKSNIKRLEDEVVTLSTQNNELAELKNNLQKDVNEMQKLKQQLESPSADYIKSKSSLHDLVVIPSSQHSELNDTVADLGSKLESLKSTLDATSIEKKALQQKVVDLEAKHASPSVEYISSKLPSLGFIPIPIVEHNSLKSELQRRDLLLKQKEKQLSELSELKDTNEEQLQKANSALASLTHSHEHPTVEYLTDKLCLFDMIPVLESEYNDLVQSKSNAIQLVDEKKKEIESLKLELEKLKNEKVEGASEWEKKEKDFVSRISISQSEIENLNNKLREIEVELEQKSSKLKDSLSKIDSLNLRLNDMENEIDAQKSEISDVQSKHAIKTSESEELSSALNALKSENESLKTKVLEAETLASTIAANEQHKAALESEVSLLKDQLNGVTEKLSISEQKSDALVKDYESQIETLNVEITRLNEKIDVLNKELEMKSGELSDAVNKLEENERLHREQVADLEEQEADYIEKLSTIKAELKCKTIECENISAQNATEISVQLEEIKKLKSSSSLLSEKISSIELELEEKEMKFQAAKSELESTLVGKQTELDELRANNAALEKQLLDVKFENEAAKSALEDARVQLEKLKESRNSQNLVEPIQNFEMAKSSSNATITNGILDELNKQPVDSLVSVLQQKGYVVVPHEEFNQIISNKNANVADELENITHDMEDIEHDLQEKQHALEELETQSRSDISSFNSSVHSEVIPVEQVLSDKYNSLKFKVDGITSELEELNSKKKMLSKQLNRLSVASTNEATSTLNQKITKKIEKVDAQIEVKQVELKFQQSALAAVKAYITKSKDMDLPPITHVVSSASSDQIINLEKEINELRSEYEHKKETLEILQKEIKLSDEPEHLANRLNSLGYTVVAPSGDQLYLKGIILHGLNFSVNSLIRMEHFDKKTGSCNIDNLIKKKGYSLVPVAELERLRKLSNPTVSDLKANALKHGYVIIKDAEMKDLTERIKMAKLPESLTVDELQNLAAKNNFEMLPKMEVMKLRQRTITTHDLAKKAESLKLVLLSKEEVNKLKANTPITKANVIEKGKQFDLLCIPAKQFVATTVSKTPDIPNVVVLPNSYYNVLTRSHDWYKKNKQQTRVSTPTQNHRDSPSMSPSPSINDHTGIESFTGKHLLPPANLNNLPGQFDAASLYTVDSVISNKREIIAAITQTMLGTFLYKYYRKLGPLTSISDTRHERFFWVNPYTLSLLWCISNPGACDPGKANIKAATILDVKSVADNNPLPAGLYYKSLVITSYDKTIKITCPTRRIHNIWYNALKYLLDRSLENWINDDDLENQYEQDFSLDKKTELERSQSQNFRRSQQPTLRKHTSMMSNRAPPKSSSVRSANFYKSP